MREVREGLSQSRCVDNDIVLRASRRPATVFLRGVSHLGRRIDGLLVVAFDLEGGADGIVALGVEVNWEVGVVCVVGADGD